MLLSNLANVLRAAGITVVEVEGWDGRGYLDQDLASVDGVLWHHTAAGRNFYTDAPSLNICTYGRSDLAGPLCHIVLGRSGTAYLTAAGLANHAGRGSAYGIPTDAGNWRLIGIEMESSGVAPFDWTAEQIAVAPVIGAALEQEYLTDQAEDFRLQLGHKEYSSEGKIDPAGWPGDMDGLRDQINAILTGGPAAAPVISAPVTPTPAGTPDIAGQATVSPGDSLSAIAGQVNVSLDALRAVNPGISDLIHPGDLINLPVGANLAALEAAPAADNGLPEYCTVDPGDTLSGIAAQYGVSLEYLISRNPGINPDFILVDQRIDL